MEALRVEIARAAAAGTTELDWSGRGLTELPQEIGTLTKLEKLNLASNELSSLPEALAQCASLHTLFFLNNRFTAIPSVVGRLPSLFMLSFKSNRLETIPEDALPPTLGWLILTDNALSSLPASLGRLPRLRKLMLASNQLRTLPDMSGLHSLELVRLSDNRLDDFPEALFTLSRLAWVALAGNAFPPMPRSQVDARLAGTPSSVSLAQLKLGDVLGEGTSGVVYSATRLGAAPAGVGAGGGAAGCSGDDKVAVKMFKAASSDGRPVDEVRARIKNKKYRSRVLPPSLSLSLTHTRTPFPPPPPPLLSSFPRLLLPLLFPLPTKAWSTWWAFTRSGRLPPPLAPPTPP
jgi:hypothetical protein